jgi:hypothetical protein
MPDAVNAPRLSERNGMATDVEPNFVGRRRRRRWKTGQRWSKTPEEIGAANALVFNPDGTVTAVSEGHRHGVGSALCKRAPLGGATVRQPPHRGPPTGRPARMADNRRNAWPAGRAG